MLRLDNNSSFFTNIRRYILVKRINKALNINLTKAQLEYIFNGCNHFIANERKQGKTTAHCIRLCLRKEPVIKDYLLQGAYSEMFLTRQYDRYFAKEFLNIRNILKENGIKVCEII